MAVFTGSESLRASQFLDTDLRHSRFIRSSLSGVVMRGVDIDGADIDAPWLLDGAGTLLVNGVDVAPLVDAELNRRFPGREARRADTAESLRAAWTWLEEAWAGALERAASTPPGTVDVSVDGEWSFAQTLRHLIMATDTWLRRAILQVAEPYSPVGLPNVEYEADGGDPSVFNDDELSYEQVLDVRAERVGMVRDFLSTLEDDALQDTRTNPWAPQYPETVLSCVHTILEEEWEHLRFALRDLDAIEDRGKEDSSQSAPPSG